MPIIGKHEIFALLFLSIFVGLELINKPLCAVCFFMPPPQRFIHISKGSSVQGIITSEPNIGYKSQRITVSLNDKNRVLVFVNRYQQFSYGDRVYLQGEIGKPQNVGTFDYASYLLRQNIDGVSYYPRITTLDRHHGTLFWNSIYALKDFLRRPILQNLPEPHGSFILSMTVGDDWRISPAFRQALINSGTIHIISISGLHMTIIVAVVVSLFLLGGLSRFWATIATAAVLTGYILLVGSPSAAIRSGIMSMLLLIGYLVGGLSRLLYALALAAILMVLWDSKVIYDVGFQLSFAAMAGLALFYPRFREWFYQVVRVSESLAFDIIPASLSANVAIFPIVAYHFGSFSLIGPLANLFVLPVIPPLMILGFFTELTGLFSGPLWLIAEYHVRIISLFGNLL